MLRPEPCSFLCDRGSYREGFDINGVEQNPPVFIGELRIPQTQRMYENFNKSQHRSDHAQVALVYGIKERTQVGKVARILLDQVNQRSRVKAYDRTAERVYPFHDERS
jgi:hypothetical protein